MGYLLRPLSAAPESNIEDRLLTRLARASNRLFCRVYHRVGTIDPPKLPREGPAILVCNHVSGLDPMLIQSTCRRLIIWMMAREYYDIRTLTWLYKLVGAIPVERSGRDLAATRAALRALHQGRVVGVFPEGKIETDQNLLPFQTGVALMAIKTGVPVYPAYLDGTQRGKEMLDAIAHPNRAVIRFGPAVEFARDSTSKDSLEEATDRIREAIWALRDRVEAEIHRDAMARQIPGGAAEAASTSKIF